MGDIGGVFFIYFSLFQIYWSSFIFYFLFLDYCPLSICGEERRMCSSSSQSVSGLSDSKLESLSHLISSHLLRHRRSRGSCCCSQRKAETFSRGRLALSPFVFCLEDNGRGNRAVPSSVEAVSLFFCFFGAFATTAGFTGLICCIRPGEWKVYVRTYLCHETSIYLVLSLLAVVSGHTQGCGTCLLVGSVGGYTRSDVKGWRSDVGNETREYF